MLNVLICLGGVFAILMAGEAMWRLKLLRGEFLRKFIHIFSGIFIASWPWLISWRLIQLVGVAMLVIVFLNQRRRTLHTDGEVRRQSYGALLFAVAVTTSALITTNKLFFALAVLQLGLADGMAAIAGTAYRHPIAYKVFGHKKSVYGSVAFWLTSSLILGIGLLFDVPNISLGHYLIAIAILPPILAVLENISVRGSDNIALPVATIVALRLLT